MAFYSTAPVEPTDLQVLEAAERTARAAMDAPHATYGSYSRAQGLWQEANQALQQHLHQLDPAGHAAHEAWRDEQAAAEYYYQ